MNTLYETMKNSNRETVRNVGLAMTSLGQLLLLMALVTNLNDLLSGFLLAMSIMLNVLSITFLQSKILGK